MQMLCAQASERLDAVVAHVLLKIQPPVFFGHRVLKTLHQRCMQHDATIPSLMKALHVRPSFALQIKAHVTCLFLTTAC